MISVWYSKVNSFILPLSESRKNIEFLFSKSKIKTEYVQKCVNKQSDEHDAEQINRIHLHLVMLCKVEWVNKWVLSRSQKMVSDSAVLMLVGSSFHHRLNNREESALRWAALFALSDGVTSRPADVGEQSAHAGTCGLPVFGGRQVQFIDVYDRAELDVGCSRKPLEVTEELRHMGEFG